MVHHIDGLRGIDPSQNKGQKREANVDKEFQDVFDLIKDALGTEKKEDPVNTDETTVPSAYNPNSNDPFEAVNLLQAQLEEELQQSKRKRDDRADGFGIDQGQDILGR